MAHHAVVEAVPVTVDLVDHPVRVSTARPPRWVRGASILVQAACLHSPDDLVIAAAVPEPVRSLTPR